MTVKHGLRMLRRRERRLLDSRVTVTRGSTGSVTTVGTNRPCNIVPAESMFREVEVGGATVRLHLYAVAFAPNENVRKDDVLTVTATRDTDLSGRWLTVLEVVHDDWVTLRRVLCVEGR